MKVLGYINGAIKMDQILHPYKATFYIIVGYLDNISGRGDVSDWQVLPDKGHDIGSHTITHSKMIGTDKGIISKNDINNP